MTHTIMLLTLWLTLSPPLSVCLSLGHVEASGAPDVLLLFLALCGLGLFCSLFFFVGTIF